MPPRLTLGRWTALMALRDQPELQRRPFSARELKVMPRSGKRRPASGATLAALRSAGWAEKITVNVLVSDAPFQTQTDKCRWQITEAGRKAIAACPDEYPGDPVYGGD